MVGLIRWAPHDEAAGRTPGEANAFDDPRLAGMRAGERSRLQSNPRYARERQG